MNIGDESFEDEEIRSFINNTVSRQVDLRDLADFFGEFLGLFIKDENGFRLAELLQRDWRIFSSIEIAERILSAVIELEGLNLTVNDKVSYIPEIQSCFARWERLKSEVKSEKRYFTDLRNFDWETYLVCNAVIKSGQVLYRARISMNDHCHFDVKDMGCPPIEKATAGRANPLGIPYLYLCHDAETTLYEVRAVYLDKVSVGKFVINSNLDIVDFSSDINLFYAYTESGSALKDIIQRKIIFNQISADLSKPLRRFDSELEYVPTQMICEYCKLNGADGIRFNSSLHKGGKNIVLFNYGNAVCVEVTDKEVNNVIIESK